MVYIIAVLIGSTVFLSGVVYPIIAIAEQIVWSLNQ